MVLHVIEPVGVFLQGMHIHIYVRINRPLHSNYFDTFIQRQKKNQ